MRHGWSFIGACFVIEIEVYGLGAIGSVPSWMYGMILAVFVVGCGDIVLTQKTRKTQKIAILLLVEYVALVFCTTVMFRNTRAASEINLMPLSSYFWIAENSYLWEVSAINLLNIAMFVPVGFLLKCGFRSIAWKKVLITGGILSATIEIIQFIFCKGLCEIDDVIHNIVGCMLGYGIATLILRGLKIALRNNN